MFIFQLEKKYWVFFIEYLSLAFKTSKLKLVGTGRFQIIY